MSFLSRRLYRHKEQADAFHLKMYIWWKIAQKQQIKRNSYLHYISIQNLLHAHCERKLWSGKTLLRNCSYCIVVLVINLDGCSLFQRRYFVLCVRRRVYQRLEISVKTEYMRSAC